MNSENLRYITTLPVIPESCLRLRALLSSFEGDYFELIELFQSDYILSAMLLKFANSPLYNFSGRRVTSISDCVNRLGCDGLSKMFHIALVENVHEANNHYEIYQVWHRSFVLKSLAEALIECSSLTFLNKNTVVTASLLQDMGHFARATYASGQWLDTIADAKIRGCDVSFLEECENSLVPHGELAATILEQWKISSDITIPIRYHEHPDRAPKAYRKESHLLNCATSLLSYVLPSIYGKRFTKSQIETILQQNGISAESLTKLVAFVHDESDRSRTLLSLWGMGDHLSKLRTTGSTSLLRPV